MIDTISSTFLWSEKRSQVVFCWLKWELRTGEDQHFIFEDWWSVAAKDCLKMKFWLLITCVGASSCSLCALETLCCAFLTVFRVDSAAGLRNCKAGNSTSTHSSEECEAAVSAPWPGTPHLPRIPHLLHQITEQTIAKHKGWHKEEGRNKNAGSRAGWVKSSPSWGGAKYPRLPSWHEISFGPSPGATWVDARAETWTWSPPGAESSYVWVAHTWQAMLDATEKAAVLSLLCHPHSNLRTHWKLNLQIQCSFLWHSLTSLISDSECNLQGWTPEPTDTAHRLREPPNRAWHWLSLIAELSHQVCHHVPRKCGARRWLMPSSQRVSASGRDGSEILKALGLCSTQQTAPSRVCFLPAVNCVKFYL